MPATACLLAVYATTLIPPWNDSSDAIVMIFPSPRPSIWRPQAWLSRNAASRLTSSTCRQSRYSSSTAGLRRAHRDRPADAAAGAGDQRGTALQREQPVHANTSLAPGARVRWAAVLIGSLASSLTRTPRWRSAPAFAG